jgi:integrase
MPHKGESFPAEVYSRDTIEKLLSKFGKSKTDVRNRALLLVYWRCQLRCAEALDLQVSDVDFDRGAITVKLGKGRKRRVVGVDRETLEYLKAWLAVRPESKWLFCTHKGGRISEACVRQMVKRKALKAGITQRVHVHGFRHTGACELASRGLDLRLIQKQLGHSSLAVTDRYLDHLAASEVVDQVAAIDWTQDAGS